MVSTFSLLWVLSEQFEIEKELVVYRKELNLLQLVKKCDRTLLT